MKKALCAVLFLLLILITVTACKNEQTETTNANTDYLSNIMKSPDEHPQLTKEEFIEITNNYLSTNEWVLPIEKACFCTSGVNYSAFIIQNEYLFTLLINTVDNKSEKHEIALKHYLDGVVTESESDPLLFEDFLN